MGWLTRVIPCLYFLSWFILPILTPFQMSDPDDLLNQTINTVAHGVPPFPIFTWSRPYWILSGENPLILPGIAHVDKSLRDLSSPRSSSVLPVISIPEPHVLAFLSYDPMDVPLKNSLTHPSYAAYSGRLLRLFRSTCSVLSASSNEWSDERDADVHGLWGGQDA